MGTYAEEVLENCKTQPEVVDDIKERVFSIQNMLDALMKSVTVPGFTRPAQGQARQISQHREREFPIKFHF